MTDPESGAERRAHPQLRTTFIDFYDILQPFFDPAYNWGGRTHEHLAYRALHERFPKLSSQEIFTLVSAARRVFNTGGKPAAP